ncbi:integral membrane protein, YjbE family [Noviherbaspirillum humi]|uniref:Integral membrane protein, YjbE family n=1 Tax=Noviherbaspirillum humi TaxID=1688639 RepID=A0A239E2Q1_9BURK|nr:TerC family protein [Noviherbaspirillum humi]SNS38897.1 integral membrane protein, YjbE family [Noviherbaspirillum humi]
MEFLSSPIFWAALGNIILINIVLSGDNAVVIALASRSLPPHQQRKAIVFGSAAAIVMRIILTIFALKLLTLPYLKIIGAFLLLYIGIQLLAEGDEDADVKEHSTMAGAIRTILVADLVMSLDNVLGVAAAAKGDITLLVLGLAISIPLIIFGSAIILKLMEKLPIIITLGAALLGYLAGEMLISDTALSSWVAANFPHHEIFGLSIPGLVGAAIVVAVGHWLANRSAEPKEA